MLSIFYLREEACKNLKKNKFPPKAGFDTLGSKFQLPGK